MKQVMEDTNGNGFDVVIECCGNDKAVSSALMTCKPGGMIVLVGVALGAIYIPTVVGVMSELTMKGAIAYTKEEFQTCIDLIAIQHAYERLTSGVDPAVKILVDPNK